MNVKFSITVFGIITLLLIRTNIVYGDVSTTSNENFINPVSEPKNEVFSSGFSVKDVNRLLIKFESAFEAGDIIKFISLFEKNVKTEDGNGRGILEEDYIELFTTTDRRNIQFRKATWNEDNNGIIWGDVDFMLNIRNRINKEIRQFSGAMRIYFKKRNKRLSIDGIFHAYDEKTTQKNKQTTMNF